jgi:hypothetical protein
MAAPVSKSMKNVVVICSKCGKPKTVVSVIINHKTKSCLQCGCGIFDKSGKEIK